MTEPKFKFEKKVILNECLYGNVEDYIKMFSLLIYCMKETNKLHNDNVEFFRLDMRNTYFDERPEGICFHLKWGNGSIDSLKERELEMKERKTYQDLPDDDNKICYENGKKIFLDLKEKYPKKTVEDFDKVSNSILSSVIFMIHSQCAKEDHQAVLQWVYKILQKNL